MPALACSSVLWLILVAACGNPPRPAPEAPPPAAAALTIPPGDDAGAALAALTERAPTDPAAAWERLHYLLDLFDDARYRRADDSLRLLARAMGEPAIEPPLRGPTRTEQVAAFLLVQADDLLAGERLHPDAHATRRLLLFDLTPPRTPADAARALDVLRSVAQGNTRMRGNAALRLFGHCRRALEDAAAAAPAERAPMLDHCRQALGRADADVATIHAGLEQLLRLVETSPRLAPAAAHQRSALADLGRLTGSGETPPASAPRAPRASARGG